MANSSRQRNNARERNSSDPKLPDGRSRSDTRGSRSSSHSSNKSDDQRPTKKKPKKTPFTVKLLIVAIVISSLPLLYSVYSFHLQKKVITPLGVPRIIQEGSAGPGNAPERFWGTYRPGVYFGLKTRSPQPLVTGLMWFKQFSKERPLPIRHTCEQSDKLLRYGWLKHDGLNFGIQEIVEKEFVLKTEFVKKPGGDHGGDWSARISGQTKGKMPIQLGMMFYTVLDGEGTIIPAFQNDLLESIRGQTEELGSFSLKFPKAENVVHTHFLVSNVPNVATVKDHLQRRLHYFPVNKTLNILGLTGVDTQTLNQIPDRRVNLIVHQITVKFPFKMEVLFESGSVVTRSTSLEGEEFDKQLKLSEEKFDEKFEDVFQVTQKGFQKNETNFAKAALSNLIGGIGYFYGASIVMSKYNKEPIPYWEAPLMTAVPSRSFFPRGFLWDEGFHNLLINRWDPELSMEIIGHWLDLMNVEGWIPREQILGMEARSKVPTEFVVQRNTNANPPTLFLPIQSLLSKEGIKSDSRFKRYLQVMFPRLVTWYDYFNKTQTGPVPGSYRWRGRDYKTNVELNPKTLTSGFDDFPRASHPSDDEMHIDLRCWMALASQIMAEIAEEIGEDASTYLTTYKSLSDNKLLDDTHWSASGNMYSDFGNHAKRVALERAPQPPPPLPKPGRPIVKPPKPPLLRVVRSKEGPTKQFVNSFGYVSLFPFLLKILEPSSPKLGIVLTDLNKTSLLWTKFGLRSLAKSDPIYMKHNTEHDPPYWRGAIWINVNYLAVRALHHYSNVEGPFKEQAGLLYTELRKNVISNMVKQYYKSGYIWENYNDSTGKGQGSHPFTGWSSLVVLLMSEMF